MFRLKRGFLSICFTICLFISSDSDGHRAPKNGSLTLRDQYISYPLPLKRYVSRYR